MAETLAEDFSLLQETGVFGEALVVPETNSEVISSVRDELDEEINSGFGGKVSAVKAKALNVVASGRGVLEKAANVYENNKTKIRLAASATAVSLALICGSGEVNADAVIISTNPVTPTTEQIQPADPEPTPTPRVITVQSGVRSNRGSGSVGTGSSGGVKSGSSRVVVKVNPTSDEVGSNQSQNSENELQSNREYTVEFSEEMAELPEGKQTLFLRFSGAAVGEDDLVKVNLGDITGIGVLDSVGYSTDASSPSEYQRTGEYIVAQLESLGYKVSAEDESRLKGLEYGHGAVGDDLIFSIYTTNEDVTLTDPEGNVITINPYQHLVQNGLYLGVGGSPEVSRVRVSNDVGSSEFEVGIKTNNAEEVQQSDNSVTTIAVDSSSSSSTDIERSSNAQHGNSSSRVTGRVVGSEEDFIPTEVVEPGNAGITDNATEDFSGTESVDGGVDWKNREWEVNETVPAKAWWDDMVSKGYIRLDNMAEKYAGDEIRDFVEAFDLVPDSEDYYKTGKPFAGTLESKLRDLQEQGQGHITISPEAYDNIPGPDADLYLN